VLLHAAIVLLLLIPLLKRDFARVLTVGESLTTRSGGGGGRVAYITLPTPKAPARATVNVTPPLATPPAIVVPTPTPPPEIPPPTPEAQVAVAAVAVDSAAGAGATSGDSPGAGGGTGGGEGPGAGPGTGPGSGDRGTGRAVQLRHQVIPPEDPPKALRGVELRITFLVDESGRPVRVEFDPPIQDKKFAQKLRESMLSYRFRPALGPDGRPVASTFIQLVSW
jgi:hypothetical protein